MLTNFLNHNCDVIDYTTSLVGGEEIKTEVPIYSGIACHLYNNSGNLKNSNLAENTELNTAKMLVEPNRTALKAGMVVSVTDGAVGSLGRFQIEVIQVNRLADGTRDSIQLTLKSI